MNHDIGIGVIGMGWMGSAHSRAYRQIADRFPESGIRPRLVICADEVERRAREAQSALGFQESTHGLARALSSTRMCRWSTSPRPTIGTWRWCSAAAQLGKHVFCEKPVGRSPQETAQIELLARQAGVMSFVGFNYRWAPMVQHLHGLIQDGRLGRLTHYRGRFFSMYGSNPLGLLTWRFQEEYAGLGVLGDIMSHVVDMAHMLAGPVHRLVSHRHTFIPDRPLPVPGQGTHFSTGAPGDPTGPVTNEDYVSALVEFENGAQRHVRSLSRHLRAQVRDGAGGQRHARRRQMELRAHERARVVPARRRRAA